MNGRLIVGLLLAGMVTQAALAQRPAAPPLGELLIGRNTFFDFGPPFDFYEIFRISQAPDGLLVEKALATPGYACQLAAKVDTSSTILHRTLTELLGEVSPCGISSKQANRELNRCKHCLSFSGQRIKFAFSCGGKARVLDSRVLDADLFSQHPAPPQTTSWTMHVLETLDKELGSSPLQKPLLEMADPANSTDPNDRIVTDLRAGVFDRLFDGQPPVSEIAKQAMVPLPQPSVALLSSAPDAPIEAALPNYPPIGRAAHVGGDVSVRFVVSDGATGRDISITSGPKLFEHAVRDTISNWRFAPSAIGHTETAIFRFQINCPA